MDQISDGHLRIAISGGGSGGHTSAAVGIVQALVEAGADKRLILWIGSSKGIEGKVAERESIPFKTISVGKLRRYWSIENLVDVPRIIKGTCQSFLILRRYRPSIVVGTGGFVSVPVVVAARLLKIPIVVHEQTIVPGLANRIASRFASVVLIAFQESATYFRAKKVEVVGNPLRSELRHRQTDRAAALEKLGLDPSFPLLYVTGGAQGANAINKAVADALPELLSKWQIIHQCGDKPMAYGESYLNEVARELDRDRCRHYVVKPYIGAEIVDVFAASDVLLSRSGAATINEITRLGLPSILVPYPLSVANEQERLARRLEEAGAALVIEQTNLNKESLLTALEKLGKEEREAMKKRALALAPQNVEERITQAILGMPRKT
jgi:UDP-N-acetylglucosamine--N-acetylmuramyl-(pentapeptide) pyrophosphoryl-undecaprenol N-acetylglucosamine transferase